MSEEYNPEARTLEEAERIEVELKEVIHKRDSVEDPKEKAVLERQVSELETRLKQLRPKLG